MLPIVFNIPKSTQRKARDPNAAFERGVAALQRGDRDEGRAALLQVLELVPPTLERMVAVADELAEAGLDSDAGSVLRKAIERFL